MELFVVRYNIYWNVIFLKFVIFYNSNGYAVIVILIYSEYSYSAVFGGETKPHCVKTALIEQSFM